MDPSSSAGHSWCFTTWTIAPVQTLLPGILERLPASRPLLGAIRLPRMPPCSLVYPSQSGGSPLWKFFLTTQATKSCPPPRALSQQPLYPPSHTVGFSCECVLFPQLNCKLLEEFTVAYACSPSLEGSCRLCIEKVLAKNELFGQGLSSISSFS